MVSPGEGGHSLFYLCRSEGKKEFELHQSCYSFVYSSLGSSKMHPELVREVFSAYTLKITIQNQESDHNCNQLIGLKCLNNFRRKRQPRQTKENITPNQYKENETKNRL